MSARPDATVEGVASLQDAPEVVSQKGAEEEEKRVVETKKPKAVGWLAKIKQEQLDR